MKNLKKTILTVLIAICSYGNANAQATEGKTRGKVVNPGPIIPRIMFSAGYGNTMPTSTAKDANFTNSSAISGDLFVPFSLFRKGWDAPPPKEHKISLGLNLEGTYSFGGSGNPSKPLPEGYTVSGASSSGIVYKGVDPRNPGFRTGIGPQANFHLGKFIISPMVLGEYFSMTQKELSVVQTIQYNGQSYDFNLTTIPETKTTGFAVTPKIRMQYMISEHFGFFADASYTMGPKAETTISTLVPNGNPQTPSDTYNLQQLQTGTMVKGETKSTALNAMGFNIGVVIGFGKTSGAIKKGWNGKGDNSESIKKGWNGKSNDDDGIKKGWNGKADVEVLVSELSKNNGSSKKYYNDKADDCSATSGIECVDEISVSDDFDLTTFDTYVSTNNPERIKDIFKNNDMEKFLGSFMTLPNSKEIISSLKKGDLTIKKINSKSNTSTYQLGTPEGISMMTNTVKIVLAKKHNYVGHVTLLR